MPKLIDLAGNSENLSISNVEIGNVISRYKTERMNYFPLNLKDDSTSVWISKGKILELFAKNPESDGIRFYYGVIDDPITPIGIHNIIIINTNNGRQDQVGDNNWVIVAKNAGVLFDDSNVSSILCPPPIDRCQGRYFSE